MFTFVRSLKPEWIDELRIQYSGLEATEKQKVMANWKRNWKQFMARWRSFEVSEVSEMREVLI